MRAGWHFAEAVGTFLIAKAALVAGIAACAAFQPACALLPWLWGIFYVASAAVIATGTLLVAALVRLYRAGQALRACQAGGGGTVIH